MSDNNTVTVPVSWYNQILTFARAAVTKHEKVILDRLASQIRRRNPILNEGITSLMYTPPVFHTDEPRLRQLMGDIGKVRYVVMKDSVWIMRLMGLTPSDHMEARRVGDCRRDRSYLVSVDSIYDTQADAEAALARKSALPNSETDKTESE